MTWKGQQALNALWRNHPQHVYGAGDAGRPSDDELLRWAATLPDGDLMDMRNLGSRSLAWIREQAPLLGGEAMSNDEDTVDALAEALDAMLDTAEADGLRPEWWDPYVWAKAQLFHLRRVGWDVVKIEAPRDAAERIGRA